MTQPLYLHLVAARRAARGFTLLEVMVALFIIAIGMLGIAKIQALAYASTGSASLRSLVAIEAASLASVMRANRAYWSTGSAPASLTITGTTISDATLNGTATTSTYCISGYSAPCGSAVLAAYDLHQWATALNKVLLNSSPTTTISCPTTNTPISCTVQISWIERTVAINKQGNNVIQGTTGTPMQIPTYTLHVEP